MKIKLKNTPEQVELIKAMGSRDNSVSAEASQAFAAFIGPVVSKVLLEAGTASKIYSDSVFDEDDNPSIPLDLFHDASQDHVTVWSQNVAGGLPTSTVEGMSELKVATYRLDSAVSFLKRYARRGRLDVVSKAVERMTNEVLIKQERNAWAVVLKALADARTGSVSNNSIVGGHVVYDSAATGTFALSHLNKLMTLVKRLNTSYAGGSTTDAYGLTDIFVSPEIKEDIRSFAYQPTTTSSTSLSDSVKEDIYRSAGAQEIYGVTIHELVELGVNGKYTALFNGVKGAQTFTSGTDELVVGLDLSKEAFIRPVARQSDSGGTFTVLPDDQFLARSEKTGFYGSLEEGRVCIDARAIVGIRL